MRRWPFVMIGLSLVAMTVGCGSVDEKDTAKFEGMWTYDTGKLVGTCPGAMPAMSDLTGDVITITKGVSSDLLVSATPECAITFNVGGDRATAVAGQTCMLEVTGIGPLSVGVSSWTMDILDAAAMPASMTAAMSGKVTVPLGTSGLSVNCDVVGDGTLTKQP